MESNQNAASAHEEAVSDVFPELFHYTSMSALQGILKSKSLWATQVTHLNDTTEAEVIWPRIHGQLLMYYKEAMEQRIRNNSEIKSKIENLGGLYHVAEAEAATMTSSMRSQLLGHDTDPSTSSVAPAFVCSFTTHGDDSDRDRYHREHGMLSQWRGYGGSAGIAIVFDTKKLESFLVREYAHFDYLYCHLADVFYDSGDFALTKCFPKLSDALSTYASAFVELDHYAAVLALLNDVVSEFPTAAGRLKHGAFREERECRIVVGPLPVSVRIRLASEGKSREKAAKAISHRLGHSSAIPYIRLFEQIGEDLPITRIIVGPSRNQRVHMEAVRDLVKAGEIEVQGSEIPFVASRIACHSRRTL